ncbi:MAG: ShlB/FhaC/HecB family hemolysin secretion/activation protein [Pseudomonadota bacterium]
MSVIRHSIQTLCMVFLLVVPQLASAGSAFPPFRMNEFEEATTDEDVFERFREEDEGIDIPRVGQRVYGTADIQKYPVQGLRVEGVKPYVDRGITPDVVQDFVDRRYLEEQDVQLDDNGFTRRDLQEIGSFLREMLDRGGYDEEDLNNLVDLTRLQEARRGWLTIQQLENIADSVTEFYRERGFILATAYVPAQEAEDGIITISVLEGRLGDVIVSNNEIFRARTIKRPFAHEIGQAVTEGRIESTLRRVNDLPGVRVRGSFSAGEKVGETRLNLGVLEESSWSSRIFMDNHGAETTGVTRLFASAEWYNFANRGHRLVTGVLQSEGPDSSTFGLMEYDFPVTPADRGRLKTAISTNQFSVTGLASLPNIVGETDNVGMSFNYQLLRSRTLNLNYSVGYQYKDAIFDVENAPLLSRDEQLGTLSLSVDYNQLWDDRQLLISGRLGVDQGNIFSGAQRDQSTDFTKVLFNLNLLQRFSIDNWLTKNRSAYNFVVRLNGQYAPKFLSSVEQFSLGGPNGVRAFSVSDVSVDSGAYAGFELFFDLPFTLPQWVTTEPVKPFMFFDYAYGVARSIDRSSNRDAVIKGYGLGFRYTRRDVTANVILATPRSATFDDDFSDAEGETRFLLDFSYRVH